VLANDGYNVTIQVPNVQPGAVYYVAIKAANPNGSHNVGNYFLGVDFTAQAAVLQTLTQGQLTPSQPQSLQTLTTDMSGVFHFVLSADGVAGAFVRMMIYDDLGNVIFGLQVAAGQSLSGNVYLGHASYHVRFVAVLPSGVVAPLNFTLRGTRLSDNDGPSTVDPSNDPSGATTQNTTMTTSSSDSSSSGVPPQDSSSDPYTGEEWNTYAGGQPTYDGSTWQSSGSSTGTA
jgi:hypothetical protein